MHDSKETIEEFLTALSAKQPTPGGGSVAALAGALAAATGQMVVNYSLGKKNLAVHEKENQAALAELQRAGQVMLRLMVEDQAAYDAASTLRKLPQDSPERTDKYPAALLACIRIPQATAATAVAILELCDRLVDRVNRYLLSDLAVCAELAMAAARCGAHNVRVNVREVDDPAERAVIETSVNQLLGHAAATIQRVVPRITGHVSQGP